MKTGRGDAALSWLLSAGIHAALLLIGTSLALVVPGAASGWGGYTGFDCALKDRGPAFDRIERPKDEFNQGPPAPDASRFWSDDYPVGSVSDYGPVSHTCWCGYCGTSTPPPPLPRPFATGGDAVPTRSLKVCRRSFPTLRHALHLAAHKVDLDCPECLERAAAGW